MVVVVVVMVTYSKPKKPKQPNKKTTFNNGYLGSRNDEERSEMRYVM